MLLKMSTLIFLHQVEMATQAFQLAQVLQSFQFLVIFDCCLVDEKEGKIREIIKVDIYHLFLATLIFIVRNYMIIFL